MNFFQRFFFKRLTKQLRKPQGRMAKKVANRMNVSNADLYDFAFDNMTIESGQSILEIGFGNGKLFHRFFDQAAEIKMSGLDYSADMVNEAHQNNPKLIDSGQLTIQQGSSDANPYPDESFDWVLCINVLYFWDDSNPHFQEVLRVLKRGGKFMAIIRNEDTMRSLPFTDHGFTAYSKADGEKLFRDAGFQDIQTVQKAAGKRTFAGKTIQLGNYGFLGTKPQ